MHAVRGSGACGLSSRSGALTRTAHFSISCTDLVERRPHGTSPLEASLYYLVQRRLFRKHTLVFVAPALHSEHSASGSPSRHSRCVRSKHSFTPLLKSKFRKRFSRPRTDGDSRKVNDTRHESGLAIHAGLVSSCTASTACSTNRLGPPKSNTSPEWSETTQRLLGQCAFGLHAAH